MLALGPTYAFLPHGTQFSKPLTVRVPFDAASVPSDVTPVLLQAEPGGAFTQIPAQVDGAAMTATVSSFSWFVVARDGTHGTLLVRIAGEPDSTGASSAGGYTIRTGPAGTVYAVGSGVLDSAYTGSSPRSCFVAKLTTTLGAEWIHQDTSCSAPLAVGPTGNLYYVDWDTTGFKQFLNSLNPAGTVRTGFPVLIPDVSCPSILVSVQDDPTLICWEVVGSTSQMSRAVLGSFTSSGMVKQPISLLSFGTAVVNDYTNVFSATANNAGLFFDGSLADTSGTLIGSYMQRLDSGGSEAPGFPVVRPEGSAYGGLVSLPATTDVVGLTDAQMFRYHEDGTLASGFPHTLASGSNRLIRSPTAPVSDTQGNVYFVATLEVPATDPTWPDSRQSVLSYTSDGALRSGYPMLVGYTGPDDTSPSQIVDMAVDGRGTMYFIGTYHQPKTGYAYLAIERLPAH
jgi:hypothetical protein